MRQEPKLISDTYINVLVTANVMNNLEHASNRFSLKVNVVEV